MRQSPQGQGSRPSTLLQVATVAVLSLAGAALTCGVATGFWLLARPSWLVVASGGPPQAADLLLLGFAATGVLVTLWIGVGFLVATVATLPGVLGSAASTLSRRLAPAAVRRVAVVLTGAVLAATTLPAAQALALGGSPSAVSARAVSGISTIAPGATHTGSSGSSVPAPDPGFAATDPPTTAGSPDPAFRPTDGRPPATMLGPLAPAPRATQSASFAAGRVTVVRGDSLWAIAARHLGPAATDAQIAAEWPRWYAANRGVIGTNPDLILVGQVLTRPTPNPTPASANGTRP